MPPRATARHHEVVSVHGRRADPYFWLRDDRRQTPAVLEYLAAENAHRDEFLGPYRSLEESLYAEILARVKQDDSSVPVRDHGYWYWTRYEEGREYPIYLRRRDTAAAPDEIMLDQNVLAAGLEFHQIGGLEVSPDGRLLAYAEDTVGRRQYELRIRDVTSDETRIDRIPNVEPGVAWLDDSRTFLYVEKHPVTLHGFRVRRHVLGTEPAADPIVYEERDDSFTVDVFRSKDDRLVLIGSESTVSSEWRYAAASESEPEFRIVLPRKRDHEYQVDSLAGDLVIRSNWRAPNFRILRVPLEQASDLTCWREVIGHREDIFLHGFEIFRRFLVVSERSGALRKIRVHRWDDGEEHLIASDESAYTALLADNPELDIDVLRYTYTSLTTPLTTFEYDLTRRQQTLLKREPVLGGFDAADYRTDLVWAPARDGSSIPVSLAYRRNVPRDGTAPLYQYAYGSYGISIDPVFSSARLSLLDRGFVYAIAHVRGGQELGRRWYDEGRLLAKMNTFHDFVDVTDYLVRERYAAGDKVFAMGGSAGGLLMGVIANLAPEKYRGIIAHVPFVDVVTTMLDETIPLTTLEYDEWGNPHEQIYYDYMLSYSPYDNVRAQAYPAMLVTTGFWDSQVQYWEPAKWVARLRALKTDRNPLILRVNLEAGHGGKSGRFERYREIAEEYTFVTAVLGAAARVNTERKDG